MNLPTSGPIVVGMSGGVDSSVVALRLKQQGHDVIGMFMKNWDEKDESGACAAEKDFDDVRRVCDRIGIPYYSVEFVKEYWDSVFARFLEEYRAGYTPNPDVLCNREIKFNVFLKKALSIGGEWLATGHYTRVSREGGRTRLLKGLDPSKDQSYFLHAVKEPALARTLFPIGDLQKSEVRRLATEAGLATHAKKDSTGICFIGERDFRDFLKNYLPAKPGRFCRLDGTIVGTHEGSAYYTLGQRKGLGLGGQGEAWFVVAKDPARNVVYVERGSDHPALYADELEAEEITWVQDEAPGELPYRCRAKVRYRQSDQDCVILPGSSPGRLRVAFDQPQRAITPGQSVVFYDGEVCLGGGVIRGVGATYHEQGRPLPLKQPDDPRRDHESRPEDASPRSP